MADRSVLVTGASGFVGKALLPCLASADWEVHALTRRDGFAAGDSPAVIWHKVSSLDDPLPLAHYDVVVHLAARVHVMTESAADPLAEFRRANVDTTRRLAERAAAAGVRRFVFLSSVKVNGEETSPGRPFFADDMPNPEDAYALSKHEAEVALRQLADTSGMEIVIIRPPLVYGPGVKGNFATMLKWLRAGVPLPLASVDNRRSLVGLENLCDLIRVCLDHPAAANQIFMVSDACDLSTAALLRQAGVAMGVPARLLPFPPDWLLRGAAMLGKRGSVRRLCGNLQVDIGKTRKLLGWVPPVDVDTGLRGIFSSEAGR